MTLTPFRINTYRKTGEGGYPPVYDSANAQHMRHVAPSHYALVRLHNSVTAGELLSCHPLLGLTKRIGEGPSETVNCKLSTVNC
jgi:hypothetical protein